MRRAPRVLTAGAVVSMLDAEVGAYVHVPFCTRICPFCPYNKVVPRTGQPAAYFSALNDEVRAYLEAGAAGPAGFTSLYVGGGTPTLFPDDLAGLLRRIPVAGERAIEVLPTHATPEGLDALRDMGFTAVSIGAQSFHDEVLHRLHRPHDARTARAAVVAAAGRFDLVDVDLIVDVELDDHLAGAFLRDLTDCFSLGVDQVSTYPLMRFGYTPFGQARHDRRREHEVLAEATRIATDHGYERRSVWTFNRRTSATYTSITRRRFLGMGAGASSFLGQDFLVNHFGVQAYIDEVASGRLPVARWLHLGSFGGTAYDAFWQAYTGRICPAELVAGSRARTHGLDHALAPLVAAGLLRRVGTGDPARYALTARGFDAYHDLERAVTYRLIEPLWGQMLEEHAREGAPESWATPARRRGGVAWQATSRVFERPVA
ncbi:MAG TPA: radical SAM protein [Motilibacterales bacterium]|nr:radical SAM protein [Motilibacterales bacterium]